jgi:pilus assembly protein CpaF
MSVTELTGMEGDVITIQEVFRFSRQGVSPDGTVIGRFEPTGVRPQFYERLRVAASSCPPTCSCPVSRELPCS